jgi:hypothetical protein
MNRKNRIFFILSLIILIIYSCDAPPCEDSNGVKVNIGFYHFNGTSLKDTLIDSLNITLKNDSATLFLNGTKTKTGNVAFPLSMIADSSTFVFQFDSIAYDTLTIRYTQYLKLVSHQCGFVNFFNITSYKNTTNRIDSLWIRKDLVEYGTEENIKIYF